MRTNWTDEKISNALIDVTNQLGHFPSCSDLRDQGRHDLICAVSKRGGIIAWAAKLGFDREKSASDFGWDGEDKVFQILLQKGFKAEKRPRNGCPFDILIEGILRIDVKTARYAEYGRVKGWFYRIGKLAQSDLIILFQQDTGKCIILPWTECTTSNMSITEKGKYSNYVERWDILETYLEFFRTVKTV